jgi:hypothetical protein
VSAPLAGRQAALVQALAAHGPPPAGFDADRLRAAAVALLHKRSGEVANGWPLLMHDASTRARFLAWADGRPKSSSFADGLAFAEHLAAKGDLPPLAAEELRSVRRRSRRWWPR